MACNCSAKKEAPKRYVVSTPDGKSITYSSKVEAEMAAARKGGTVKSQ